MQMPMETCKWCGKSHPISNVFCTEKRRFLVEYPTPLIVGLSAAALVAFMLVGFLGYVQCTAVQAQGCTSIKPIYNSIFDVVFAQPWPLYIWFTVLMIALQVSILRHPRLRPQLAATLAATLASSVIMGWLVFYGPLQQAIIDIEHLKFGFLKQLFSYQWTYTIINFGIIALFFVDAVLRWARRANERQNTDDASTASTKPARPSDPRVEELAAGDLVAGLALFGLMALAFTSHFLTDVLGLHSSDPSVPDSALANVPQGVPLLAGVSLSQIDGRLALFCLPLGFTVLAIAAMVWGLSAVRVVYALAPRPVANLEMTSTSVTAQVSLVVFNALRAAADRYFRRLFLRTVRSTRNVFWVLLILVASISLAVLAQLIQDYLHFWQRNPGDLLVAAFVAAVATAATVGSLALLLFSSRVASNAIALLGWLGFLLALTFWLFSLVMVAVNLGAHLLGLIPSAYTGANHIAPYLPPRADQVCRDVTQFVLINPAPGCNQPFAVSYLTLSSAGLLGLLVVGVGLRQAILNARRPPKGVGGA
jgi:hypothetical protein